MTAWLDLVYMQVKITFLSRIRYKVGLLSDFLVIAGTYLFVYFFGNGEFIGQNYSTTITNGNILLLIGFIFWQFAVLSLGFTSASISNDSATGNIESKIQSVYSLSSLYFIELVANLSTDIIIIFFMILFTTLLNFGSALSMSKLLVILLLTIPSLFGMFGVGLIVGAVVINQKRVGSLVIIVQTALLFLSNTLTVGFSNIIYLIPFTSGIDLARNYFMTNQFSISLLLIYIIVNIIWFIVGNSIFKKSILKERKISTFDRY